MMPAPKGRGSREVSEQAEDQAEYPTAPRTGPGPFLPAESVPDHVVIGRWDGSAKREVVAVDRVATVDFRLPGGQTIQVSVRPDGTWGMGGWPSTAIVTGNSLCVSASGLVPSLADLANGVAPTAEYRTYPWVLDELIQPDPPGDNAWHWADGESQQIATEARRAYRP